MDVKNTFGSDAGDAKRLRKGCFLAMVFALALGFAVAAPVLAAEDEPVSRPSIVGGDSVPDGKYEFMAALRDVTLGNTVIEQQKCGATLIDPDSVLTAAHCVDEGLTAEQLLVTVGITDLDEEDQGQTRSVTAIFSHPNYTESDDRYDAAVLKLSSPVTGILPVIIPATDSNSFETPGRSATIIGWGNTIEQPPDGDNGSNYPSRMREAQVPIVSDSKAKRAYRKDYAPDLMLAAGKKGKDSCGGDSGGPIFFSESEGAYQVGITSFGEGCGARKFPGVYTETNSDPIRSFIFGAAAR